MGNAQPPGEGLRSNPKGWIALSAMTALFCRRRGSPSPWGRRCPEGRMRGTSVTVSMHACTFMPDKWIYSTPWNNSDKAFQIQSLLLR